MEGLLSGGPWALAAGFVAVHSFFLTRPVIRLWRRCEADKVDLRAEHTELREENGKLRAEVSALAIRVSQIENGGKHDGN